MSNTVDDSIDKLLGVLAEDLINYDQRMTDADAPNVRFVHKYTNNAKQAIKALLADSNIDAQIKALENLIPDTMPGVPIPKLSDDAVEIYDMINDRLATLNASKKGGVK